VRGLGRIVGLALVVAGLAAACDRPAPPTAAPALVDLDASLEPVRADFNAHRGQARFLTLLAPT
jgi:hypothetical protein